MLGALSDVRTGETVEAVAQAELDAAARSLWLDSAAVVHDSVWCAAANAQEALKLGLVLVEEALDRRLAACPWCFRSARS